MSEHGNLETLLEAARADEAGPEVKMRVRGALTARLVAARPEDASPGGAGHGRGLVKAAGSVATGKAVLAAVLTGVIGFAAGWMVNRGAEPVAGLAATTTASVTVPDTTHSPTVAVASTTAAVPGATTTAMTGAATAMNGPGKALVPNSGHPGERRAGGPPVTNGSASAGDDAGSSLAAELALLREVRGALRDGDAARAQQWIDEHAARYPAGVLREEREAARVLALCAKGRMTEARTEAERFLSANPRSVQGDRVRGSCAFTGDGGAP